jgi:hypothetical protein
LLFGIGEGRCSNQVVGIWGLKTRKETLTDALVHGAVGRAGLVCKAGKILLDEAFLEVFARVPGHDSLAQLRRKLIEALSKHIETDPPNGVELSRGACAE